MQARDSGGRVLTLPSQTPGLAVRYGLTRADTDRELWAVDAHGRLFAGASAVNRVLRDLGGAWRAVSSLYTLPPVRWIEDRAYRWVATHRSELRFWTMTPECDQPGVRFS